MAGPLQDLVDRCCDAVPGVDWSVSIRSGAQPLAARDADRVLRTASVGKVLLLADVAARLEGDPALAGEVLARPAETVADSGLWQHLAREEVTVADACVLVGSLSDNLATNALIERFGLGGAAEVAARAGLGSPALLDRVRDNRGPADPATLSRGSAEDLAALAALLDVGRIGSAEASARVTAWLGLGVDHSMVLGGLALDPLVPAAGDMTGTWSKTGCDRGVRADVGVVRRRGTALAFAILANWADDTDTHAESVGRAVVTAMRSIGAGLLAAP